MQGAQGWRFGSFRIDVREACLTHERERVMLRGKAFELLALLAARSGHVVDKAELTAALWPGVRVHDNNLAVTVRSLRVALERHAPGVDHVQTVAGRGYRLAHAALPLATLAVARAREPNLLAEPFVAREAELDALGRYWQAAQRGAGRAVFVGGELGIGKSALVQRFVDAALAEAPHATLLSGECVPLFGAAEPHLPFSRALSRALGGPARARLLEALALHAPAWLRRLPPALTSSGADATSDLTPEAHAWDPSHGAHHLADALRALAQDGPLLLVLEDLHWADASSIDLLRLLCAPCVTGSMLLVSTHRPAEVKQQRHPLGALLDDLARAEQAGEGGPEHAELTLGAWSGAQLERYLTERFGSGRIAAELGPAMHERTEGLPLFAARLAQALVERGVLADGGDRGWQHARPLASADLRASASIGRLLASQLERLPARARELLAAASVEGPEFGTALLSEVSGRPATEVEAELEQTARGFDFVERLGERDARARLPDVRYRFRHVLYQQHLYEALGSHRRVELHRAVARALTGASELGAARPSRIAVHFERGREFSHAVAYWTAAGDDADRAYAKREALACYERAAALLEQLPVGERELRRIVLAHGRGWAHLGLGQAGAARRHFLEFARLAERLRRAQGPAREQALALAREYFQTPWSDSVLRRRAIIFPRAVREIALELHAEALHCCCHAAHAEENSAATLEHARALRELAERSGSVPRRAEALAWLGVHALSLGRARAARTLLDEALALSRSVGHDRAHGLALSCRAWLHLMQTELAAAQSAYEELLRIVPDARTAATALTSLGDALAYAGRPAPALEAYGRAARLRRRARASDAPLEGWLLRELGQLDRARRMDEDAARQLGDRGQHELLSRVLASLALTACRQSDLTAAERHVAHAQSLVHAERGGCSWRMGPLWSAQCELLAARGDWRGTRRTALGWLASASARDDALGVSSARRWLARAAAVRGDLRRAQAHVLAALGATRERPVALEDWRSHALHARIARELGEAGEAARARRRARARLEALERQLGDPAERRCLWQLADDLAEKSASPSVRR